jgi:hypothetical protein
VYSVVFTDAGVGSRDFLLQGVGFIIHGSKLG